MLEPHSSYTLINTKKQYKMKKIDSLCIIDDDPISIFGMKLIIKEFDFCDNISIYNNGEEAITGLVELTKEGKKLPSVIFLDLNMPIMDGWEFLDDFAKIPCNNRDYVTLYILSSSIDPRDLGRIKNYSMVNRYLVKPLNHQVLKEILSEVD